MNYSALTNAIESFANPSLQLIYAGSGDESDFDLVLVLIYIFWYPAFMGYLIGSIPFGLILTRIFLGKDIRTIGSGNIGATNVLRTGNKALAAATLALDFLKAFLPIILLYHALGPIKVSQTKLLFWALAYGFAAILGHCFPIWLKFKGGKGVATAFGVLLAAVPFAGMLAALTWILSAFAGRMSSLAALSAMIMAPAYTYAIYGLYPALINVAISALVIVRHKENIKRIRAGTEPKIGEKKKQA